MQVQITQQVRKFVVENFLFGDANGLKDTDLLVDQGIIDSTGVLEIVAFLEETYGFKVADEKLNPENLNSIAFVSEYVTKKLNERTQN